jgi:hypothetical protein
MLFSLCGKLLLVRARVTDRRPPSPAAVDVHAAEDLRFIRDTMASATAFTAVSGTGTIAMGLSALGAAAVAQTQSSEQAWLITWLAEAALAFCIGAIAMRRKARRAGALWTSPTGRRFMLSYAAPMVAGAIQTIAMYLAGLGGFLPGMWLLLYGTAAVAGGASSIKPIPVAGACFMTLGAVALYAPTSWGNLFMAAGFGVVQIAFGVLIARRYGG